MTRHTRLRVAAQTDTGLVRMSNEDSFLVTALDAPLPPRAPLPPPRPTQGPALERWSLTRDAVLDPPAPFCGVVASQAGVLLAVLDGMGGNCSGDIAARIAGDTLAAALAAPPRVDRQTCSQRLAAAMDDASLAICQAVATGPLYYRGIAAAAVAALVAEDCLHVASAGNCRLYLLRDGQLAQLTRDDTLAARIPAGVLTKALGSHTALGVQPDCIGLRADDVILLSSDGLHGTVDDSCIQRVLLTHDDPAGACAALVAEAKQRGSADNIAVIVARP